MKIDLTELYLPYHTIWFKENSSLLWHFKWNKWKLLLNTCDQYVTSEYALKVIKLINKMSICYVRTYDN